LLLLEMMIVVGGGWPFFRNVWLQTTLLVRSFATKERMVNKKCRQQRSHATRLCQPTPALAYSLINSTNSSTQISFVCSALWRQKKEQQ